MSRRFFRVSPRYGRRRSASTSRASRVRSSGDSPSATVSQPTPWLRLALACLCFAGFGAVSARAGLLGRLFAHDVDVITVTDVTDDGKSLTPPTALHPLRYTLVYVGETDFGRSWAGETTPTTRQALKWIEGGLKTQGYILADKEHAPDVAIVFGWGMLSGGSGRTALGFLGGTKLDLMWMQSGSPFSTSAETFDPRLLMRDAFLGGIAGKVWDFAAEDLFLGVVRCYTKESVYGDKATKLWETRFACPSTGLSLKNSLPLMIQAAAPNFGRDTAKPVNVDASDLYVGHVVLGELRVLDDDEPSPPPPAGKPAQPGEKSPAPPAK